jgi:hypothetical protein
VSRYIKAGSPATVSVGVAELIDREETLVAAACNHPNLLVLPFSLHLIRMAAQAHGRLEARDCFRVSDHASRIGGPAQVAPHSQLSVCVFVVPDGRKGGTR